MNVGYADLNTSDVATMLGVQRCTVSLWCRQGRIKYQNVSDGTNRPRYLFTDDEVNRVSKLIDKYGKKNWVLHNHIDEGEKTEEASAPVATIKDVFKPDEYIPDVDETVSDIKKLQELKVQRDKMLQELDAIDEAIKNLRQKVIESI